MEFILMINDLSYALRVLKEVRDDLSIYDKRFVMEIIIGLDKEIESLEKELKRLCKVKATAA